MSEPQDTNEAACGGSALTAELEVDMWLLERIVFSDWLLKLFSVFAWPYNWMMKARMRFICFGDCLTNPEENENQQQDAG